jgi:hypothetical protein
MVITLDAHLALTPAGRPFAPNILSLAIPVAPVVECVIPGIMVLTQSMGLMEPMDAVLFGLIVTVTTLEFAAVQTPLVTTAR